LTHCLHYGQSRYIEVTNTDGILVRTKVVEKQLCYMPLTPRLKRLFLSKSTARHMTWHKYGVRETKGVMTHPSDSDAWKVLDSFDEDFAKEPRNVTLLTLFHHWIGHRWFYTFQHNTNVLMLVSVCYYI
jgi:hypothetical protein